MKMNDYEPIRIQPLRLRGVYGITWMIYRRNFFGMFLFTLLLYGVPALLLSAISMGLFAGLSDSAGVMTATGFSYGVTPFAHSYSGSFEPGLQAFSLMMIGSLVILLFSLAFALVIQPILSGSLYTEMSARLYGQASGFRDLQRRAKFMLRRFFTTHLCQLLAEWGISMVVGMVAGVFLSVAMVALTLSLLSGPNIGIGSILSVVIAALIFFVLVIAGEIFLAFVYPAAVNEGLKNFKAVERSFKLVSKRFGRVLGASLTVVLAAVLIAGAFTAVLFLLGAAELTVALIGSAILGIVLGCLLTPYATALYTVLYFDACVRLDGTQRINRPQAAADGAASADDRGRDGSV